MNCSTQSNAKSLFNDVFESERNIFSSFFYNEFTQLEKEKMNIKRKVE